MKRLLIILGFLLILHCIFSLNKTYSIAFVAGKEVKNVPKDIYVNILNSFDSSGKVAVTGMTTVNYFGVIPKWIDFVFYLGYAILLMLIIVNSKKEL